MTALARSKYSPDLAVRSRNRACSRSTSAATRSRSMCWRVGKVADMRPTVSRWHDQAGTDIRPMRVVIIGAGFGGIGMAIELRRHGFHDVVILERGPGLGGTWLYNDYPGAACDVPSLLYSFSFAQRRDWPRLCPERDEILGYLRRVASEHDVERLVVSGVEVVGCAWDDGWTVTSADGRTWEADALIVATGQLHRVHVPRVPGTFEGH